MYLSNLFFVAFLLCFPFCIRSSYQYIDTYQRINKTTYGYLQYASKLEKPFLLQLEYIANKHGFDPNELLALIHQESLYNPSAFNINPYVLQLGKYYPSGSGNVGILQFSRQWISPLHPYKFSQLSRIQQLNFFERKLQVYKQQEPRYIYLLKQKGGLACIILGPYCYQPNQTYSMLLDDNNGTAYSMYYKPYINSWNNGRVMLWNKETKNFDTQLQLYINIERNYYKKQYLSTKK